MTVYTMFNSEIVKSFESDTADSKAFAKEYASFIQEFKYNILDYRVDFLNLDQGDSKSYVLFPGFALTDWWVLYAKVIGKARFSLYYDDPLNPATTITNNCTAYGDRNLPGIYTQSVVGLTPYLTNAAIAIVGVDNSTTVQFFFGRSAADNNAYWIANK
jgi:hypothetical protein